MKNILKISLLFFFLGIVNAVFSQTYTVTKTTDPDPFSHPYNFVDSLCDTDMYGTLAWAFNKANDDSVPSNIVFDIPGTGSHIIYLNYSLPTITGDITIDGTTQNGYSFPNPAIIIDGQNNIQTALSLLKIQNSSVNGIYIRNFLTQGITVSNSNDITISNCIINDINNGASNSEAAMAILVVVSTDCNIQGNYIGTNPSGDSLNIEDYGIMLWLNANNNLIGGSGLNQGNTIAYCWRGIFVNGSINDKISRNIIYDNTQAIFLGPGANNNKTAPDSLLYNDSTHVLSGIAEPYDSIEVFGSTGTENANEYLATTQADGSGNWNAQVQTTDSFLVATATNSANNTSVLSDISNVAISHHELNFYQIMTQYTNLPEFFTDSAEGSKITSIKRIIRDLGPRLFPHGDMKIATAAIYDYLQKFNNQQFRSATVNANWYCLGPNSNPTNISSNSDFVGQIHRITFDPRYTGTGSGSGQQTLYAASTYGGLWKSDNKGDHWVSMGTDQLPVVSTSDVAVSYQNPDNNLFICTGDADMVNFEDQTYTSGWEFSNPIYTTGVYRTIDGGSSWEPINTGLINYLINVGSNAYGNGAVCRRMIIDPNNENILYVGTSNGLFRTANAMAPNPDDVTWTRILPIISNPQEIDEHQIQEDFRGLAFKMNADFTFDSNVIYASSNKNVYISTDGGLNWNAIFTANYISSTFNDHIYRSNICVTPAAPDNLYIYIIAKPIHTFQYNGSTHGSATPYIYMYNYITNSLSLVDVPPSNAYDIYFIASDGRIPITVSYDDANKIYYGLTKIRYSNDGGATFNNLYYSTAGHADIHELKFEPIPSGGNLFCGNDGGVTYGEYPFTSNSNWFQKNNGISSALLFTCGNSAIDPDYNIIANQDNGTTLTQLPSYNWDHIGGGDGYAADILSKFNSGHGYFYNSNYNNAYSGISPDLPTEDPLYAVGSGKVPSTSNLAYNPKTFEYYIAFKEIQKLNENPPGWELASDVYIRLLEIPINDPASVVANIYISESDPNTVYAVTAGLYSDFYHFADKPTVLFKSTEGFIHGKPDYETHLSTDNPNFTIIDTGPWYNPGVGSTTFITGITGDNLSADHVWLSFSGYDQNYKVWKSIDGGETSANWINEDPNHSLPNVPVNCIVRQKNTYDRLYIGTDVGIFYKDNTTGGNWERYGDFPHVRVNEIRLNYCSKKLIVATWGRGLWEGDMLPEQNNDEEKTIDANITWTDNAWAETDVRVVSGYTLAITGTLTMPEDKQIIVEPGAKLIIDGGTITNECGKMWKGIVVKGNSNLPQTTTNQGALYVWSGATIENAQTAVTVEGGAILKASGSTFRNNIFDVKMEPYESPIYPDKNYSYFTSCFFITEGQLNDINMYPSVHLRLDNVHGINIKNCTFSNDRTSSLIGETGPFYANLRGIGILAEDADFKVIPGCSTIQQYGVPCPSPLRNTFEGLYYGIKATSTGSTSAAVSISQSDFLHNYRGLLIENINTPTVFSNTFDASYTGEGTNIYQLYPPPFGNSTYGMYLNECTGYRVENNHFNNGDAGLFVYQSGETANEIYGNQFNSVQNNAMASALSALGVNSSITGNIGLQFKCDTFNTCNYDMSLIGTGASLRQTQGNPNLETGNLLDHSCINTYSDFYLDDNSLFSFFGYYHKNGDPLICTNMDFQTHGTDNHCPLQLIAPSSINVIRQNLSTLKSSADALQSDLNSLIDGGNTDALLTLVENMHNNNFNKTCNTLLGASPYLSDTVLTAFMSSGITGHADKKRDVLLANSPLPVKAAQALDTFWLPPPFKLMIQDAQDGINPVKEKELEIADILSERQQLLNNLIASGLYNDSVPAVKDSVIDVLMQENNYTAKYFLIPLLIGDGRFTDATTQLNEMESDIAGLPAAVQGQLFNYVDYMNIVKEFAENNDTSVITDNLSFLQTLAETDNVPGSVGAQVLLERYNSHTYDYPEKIYYVDPNFTSRSLSANSDKQSASKNSIKDDNIKIYPNPANTQIVVEYKPVTENETIALYDLQGKLIQSVANINNRKKVTIDVSNLPEGSYYVFVQCGNGCQYTKQINISH